jgi:hypothetical protein
MLPCTLIVAALGRSLSAFEPTTVDVVQFNITIKELPAALEPKECQIRAHILAAAKIWIDLVDAKPCAIDIVFSVRDEVDGDPVKLGYGKSVASSRFNDEHRVGKIVSEQGLASELRTGRDPNGDAPDVDICFQTAYVLREFWWDPDPTARKKPVPSGKLDAMSAILHEFGHALAFNGWIAPKNGQLDGDFMSTYDRWVVWKEGDFFFQGPNAMKAFGKPIRLAHTVNNYHHVGEERAGISTETALENDLMTGYHFHWGKRYSVTPIDIAILADCGIPLKK